MYYSGYTLMLVSALQLAACSPMAAVGMLGSTIAKTVENVQENENPSPVRNTRPAHDQYDRQAIAEANLNLGIAYMQEGQYQQALDKLNRARIAQPDYSPTYNTLGVLYQRLGEHEEAEKYYRHAIKLAPSDSTALNNYGQFLCQQGRYEEAEKAFLESAGNPLYPTPEISITNAGICALKHGHADMAEQYFTQALARNSRFAPALLQMAELTCNRGEYLPARGYLQRYLADNKHNSKSLWLGIRIERELGDKNALSSYTLLLRNRFADSKEAALLKQSEASN
jgi:type IV pilus assembly protein PilF